jgi:hypothetical protein
MLVQYIESLKKTLADMEADKKKLEIDIEDLRALIARASSRTYTRNGTQLVDVSTLKVKVKEPSYVDLAIDALNASGTAMHLDQLVSYIRDKRGGDLNRSSIEATLFGHTRTKEPKLVKTGAATYGLKK